MKGRRSDSALIDSHAHLHSQAFDRDREETIRRAHNKGVEYIIEIGSGEGIRDIHSSLQLAKQFPFIYTTIGIHPHDASRLNDKIISMIQSLTTHLRVVGVGETGLDYHYNNSPPKEQERAFRTLISIAKSSRLPIVLHIRDAYKEAIEILSGEGASEAGGVAHCFSGEYDDARKLMDMGFYISFSGVITFPSAKKMRELVRKIPIERILIETDSPYLTPHPFRGKRNEPSFVYNVAKTIALEKGLSLEDVSRITTINTKDLFKIDDYYKEKEAKIVYPIRDSLYLNITNRCTNYCTFCAKFNNYMVKGHYLKFKEEPTLHEIIQRLKECNINMYKEVVFCGFGEPLLRLDVVIKIAKWLKDRGIPVRIDTDGLANLVHRRNILPQLKGIVDAISVSLNAPDGRVYVRYCKSRYGEEAYRAVKKFIIEAKNYVPHVTASVVALPGLDIEACRRVAEDELGVRFRVRAYNEVG